MKKKLAWLLITVFTVSFLSACGTIEITSSEPSVQEQSLELSIQEQSLEPSTQEQSSEPTISYDYSKILKGDLSDFAGTWKNGENETMILTPNGTSMYVYPDEDIKEFASDFEKQKDGSYLWQISVQDIKTHEDFSGYAITLYPVGVDVVGYVGLTGTEVTTAQTDKTRVRLYAGQGLYSADEMSSKVFYLQ